MEILDLAAAKTISLSTFSLGLILDFFLLNYRDDIWLRGRELFGSLANVRFRSLHKLVAKRILALVRCVTSPTRSDLTFYILLFASIAWSFAGMLLIPRSFGSETLAEIQNIYHVLLTCGLAGAVLGIFNVLSDWRAAQQSQAFVDWVNNSPKWVQHCYYWTIVPFYWTFAVFLCVLTISGVALLIWFAVYPPFPAARSAVILFMVNIMGDWGSLMVTYFILKRVAFGKSWWALGGPLLSILAAVSIRAVVAFASMFALVLPDVIHGVQPSPEESAGFIVLVAWLSLSVFLPTICVAAIVMVAYAYKGLLGVLALLARVFLNQAIPPDHDTVVRPFAAFGAMAAVATWGVYVFQVILI